MSGLGFLVGIIIVVVLFILIFDKAFAKQLLAKFRGRTDEIMRQDASTPEGAKDYFNNIIREKEEQYTKANNTYMEVTGKLELAKQEKLTLQKELMKITQAIDRCLDENNDDEALQWTMKKNTTEDKLATVKDTITRLTDAANTQKEVKDAMYIELQNLKEEKEKTVYQLEADAQLIELQQTIETGTSNSESERMLERVREGAKKQRERAEGARVAYTNNQAVKDRQMEKSDAERNARQELEAIKAKRKKK